MRLVPAMKDMAMTPAEAEEWQMPTPADAPRYPYGLSISLCQDELEKLNLEDMEVQPGDMVHFHAMAIVTSVSRNSTQGSEPTCRIELQITHMSAESEEEEDEADEEEEDKGNLSKLYR